MVKNSMLKICTLLFLTSVLLCCFDTAFAYLDFITEDENWSVDLMDNERTRVSITYVGASSHVRIPARIPYGDRDLPVVKVFLKKAVSSVEFVLETDGGTPVRELYGPGIDCSLTGLKVSEGVQLIGNFDNCSHLTTVILPSTCTAIDYYAFQNCSSLSRINLEHITSIGFGAFEGTALPEVLLPEGLVSVGSSAFKDCRALERVSLPSTLVTLDHSAFSGCTALTDVSFSPDFQITSLESCLFEDCTSLTDITIPDSVTSLKTSVFAGCASLENASLPQGLTAIGDYCFDRCDSFAEFTLPASVTAVGGDALPDHITKFVMESGTGLTYVPDFASDDLEELIAPVTVLKPRYSSKQFPALKRAAVSRTTLLPGAKAVLEEVTLLDPDYASNSLSGFTALREATLPDGMRALPAGMFRGCEQLYAVSLPDSLTEIGAYAFADCPMLGELDVPDSVDDLNGTAFQNDWIVLITRQGLAAWYHAKAETDDGIRVRFRDQVCFSGSVEPEVLTGADTVVMTAPDVTPDKAEYAYAFFLESEDGSCSDAKIGMNLTSAVFTGLDTENTNYTCWVVVGYTDESIDMDSRNVRTDYNGVRSNNVETRSAARLICLPGQLTEINQDAFRGIAAAGVVIPASVSSISGNPFSDSQVRCVFGWNDQWKTWAENCGYTYIPLD